MAVQQPQGLLGIHTNMPAAVPAEINASLAAGKPQAGLSAEELNAWNQLDFFNKNGLGYAIEMNNRPQTLYAIADSPVGLAAWMIDHDDASEKLIQRVFSGGAEGLSMDDVLDNVTLYWLTNTAVSSARLYWDNAHHPSGGFFDPRGIKIPVAVSAYPDELYTAPQNWAEKAYPEAGALQEDGQGRPLRGLGTAGGVQPGDARLVPVAPQCLRKTGRRAGRLRGAFVFPPRINMEMPP